MAECYAMVESPARWSDELSDFSDASLRLLALAKVLLQPCSESRKRELPLCEGDFSQQTVTVKIGLCVIVHVLTCFESMCIYDDTVCRPHSTLFERGIPVCTSREEIVGRHGMLKRLQLDHLERFLLLSRLGAATTQPDF